jgi:rfaE bifunctional protein nucleotidyltransferase chain/domain
MEEAEQLSRFFRLVQVTAAAAAVTATAAPPPPTPPFSASVAPGCLETYIRENAIEWYASWFIGSAPEIGLRGVLPGGSQAAVRRALREIRRAEARSRIVIHNDQLRRLVERLRDSGRKIAFTNGVFDLLHVGHLRLLEQARALGDALIVAINSDDSTRRLKGAGRPVIPQFARAGLLCGLRYVDACYIFPEADPMNALRTVRPDVLVKGSEYPVNRIVGARFVTSYGGTVVPLPMVPGWSTTSTIRSVHERTFFT